MMELKTALIVDKRIFILTEQDAYNITQNACYTFKINGNDYYLAKCVLLYRDVYEATFLSYDRIEVEIEIVCDEKGRMYDGTSKNRLLWL